MYVMQVQFLGEEGDDGGGPRREFFALLAREIQSSLCEGQSSRCFFRHDSIALQVVLSAMYIQIEFTDAILFQTNKFVHVGNLVAMSLLQGGSGFPYLAPPMYDYLCGEDASSIKVSAEDVPNVDVTLLLQKV